MTKPMKPKKSPVKKFFKGLLIFVVALVALIYGGVFLGHRVFFKIPTSAQATIPVLENGNLRLGAASHKQPTTTEDYIKVLAQQVKTYNQKLPELWPDNNMSNQWVVAQDIKTKKAWSISPAGKVTKVSQKKLDSYQVSAFAVNGGWSQIDTPELSGAFLAIDPEALTNFYSFQRYEHLGTYDPFITYAHELFHGILQEDWPTPQYLNAEKDERDEDTKARRKRMLLQQQLALAISEPQNQDAHIKDALATYQDYQQNDPKDFKATIYADRVEGSAYYYEFKASLYAGYPDQIKDEADVQAALTLLLTDDNPAYRASGAISEGYNVGAYAGILLDRLAQAKGESPDLWKKTLAEKGESSPLTLLAEQYSGESLPTPAKIPSEKQRQAWLAAADDIQQRGGAAENLFSLFYGILY